MGRFRLLVAAFAVLVFGGWVGAGGAAVISVHPGQAIQAAVNAASPGDTIVVAAGVYHENVTIQKNDLTLRGAGMGKTVLEPASTPTESVCSSANPEGGGSSVEGICVVGAVNQDGSFGAPVRGTTIQGLTVANFTDFGILLLNANDSTVSQSEARGNVSYGISGFVLSGVRFLWNVAHDNGDPGFYIGDSPTANAWVVGNTSYRNGVGGAEGFGFLLRDSSVGTLSRNTAWGNCAGIVFADTGENPAPENNWTATQNTVWGNNGACPGGGGPPPTSGIGIAIFGAHHVLVNQNTITGNHPTGPSIPSAGITVLSSASSGGADPTNNHIEHNTLHNNSPFDVFWDGSGSGNIFNGNICTISQPSWICP